MIRFLADHCFDEDVLRAVIRRSAAIDVVLARDVGLDDATDPEILEWAANAKRVVITHDRNTMIAFAIERIDARQPLAGLVVVSKTAPTATLVEDIILLAECSDEEHLLDAIIYVPL